MSVTNRLPPLLGRCRAWGLLLVAALVAFSCGNATTDPTGGETHFLTTCDASSGSCGGDLSCLCGVCTLPCNARTACQALPAGECVLPPTGAACGSAAAAGLCDVQCVADVDCAVVSSLHRCERGACRAGPLPANTCSRGEVPANQVLLIGDSFLAWSHQITAYLEGFARSAGTLSPGDRYRDGSSLTANSLALAGDGVAEQYLAAVADAEVTVVIMNGGGADVLLGACELTDASCPTLADAAAAAEALFADMADRGVQHIVYAFYPDPLDAVVRAKMDALRPLVQAACERSPAPCHWLDLREAFAGHYDQYLQDDGLNPSDAGSQASAAAIWATMQARCIAQ
jgi:lysophospholipase L1-like esterase